jgi:hypothetical protein
MVTVPFSDFDPDHDIGERCLNWVIVSRAERFVIGIWAANAMCHRARLSNHRPECDNLPGISGGE